MADGAVDHGVVAALRGAGGGNLILLNGFAGGVAGGGNDFLLGGIAARAVRDLIAILGAAGGMIHDELAKVVTQSGNLFLRHKNFTTNGTVLAFRHTGLRAGSLNSRIEHFRVAGCENYGVLNDQGQFFI